MRQWLRALRRTWLTGFLLIAAALGYIFYAVLWVLRLGQAKIRILILVLAAGVITAAALLAALLLPLSPPGPTIELVIPAGTPLRETAAVLKNEGVVGSKIGLVLWLKLRGTEKKVQAGRFFFRRNQGIVSAARGLLHSEPIERTVTVPEGMIVEQTASILDSCLGIDSASFVKLCTDDSASLRYGVEASTLEGYLFPDTYRFAENVTPAEVIRTMFRRFETVYSGILPDSSVKSRFSRHQIVTMASIVEKEATMADERPRISGVFHNRLRLGYPLGADPTVRYLLRKFSGPLRVSELNISSPYNTRVSAGLPPGPICSPGLASLQAAAAPLNTRDLYFVARWDGSGAHDFSETNAQHERRKMAARQRNEITRKAGSRRGTLESIP